ncbi:hypothetical protein HFN76_33615 [Rhizobium laguerreae]|uniref:three component ABC system middle component n=1 Tax=Rhizobium laguerreae TaxID=1076926 RepID=UPI001C91F7A8|nr:three component ABC system middle component [Rhizobium laguerreae]MBY3517074.1 hypothetical protein [Rhizobium laguerreae]
MNYSAFYNNLAMNAFAISAVLEKAKFLSHTQIALVLPIVAHRQMVGKLAHGSFRFVSFEQYLIENIGFFSNFNERYTASITSTVNALQLLIELGVVELKNNGAVTLSKLAFNKAMGKRAERISRASTNIAALVSGNPEIFYLNARIEL